MPEEQRNGIGTAWAVILGVLIAIIVRAVLEGFFRPLFGQRTLHQLYAALPLSGQSLLRIGQLILFLVLLGRFYWGAYRFNQEQPPILGMGVVILNVLGTFTVFAFF